MLGRKETDYSICVLRNLDYPDSYKCMSFKFIRGDSRSNSVGGTAKEDIGKFGVIPS